MLTAMKAEIDNYTIIVGDFNTPLSPMDRSSQMKKIFHVNGNQKKAGVAILVSDKIDFKIKNVTRDKEGHYIMIKRSIQEGDITIINIYGPNIGNT